MKKLGFGLMRLPMKDNVVDLVEVNKMVDLFFKEGFTYFDTAHGYLSGQSEIAFREAVSKRYPRDSYTITNKLSETFFNSKEEIYTIFEEQLKCCGVEYFDYYFMHAQSSRNYEKYQKCNAYEVALELKEKGLIKHIGISFHDSAEFLDKILCDHPEIEVVQIQLNYFDYNDEGVQSKLCLDVCNKHKKMIAIMEPVKGGNLARLSPKASKVLDDLNNGSNASFAIRFACEQEGVFIVLSGMSNFEQMVDNLKTAKDLKPLSKEEHESINKVVEIIKTEDLISCTNCRYCVDGCPKKILIPDIFSDLNLWKNSLNWRGKYLYKEVHTKESGKASECIKCGKCEAVCPQHLEIRKLLEKAVSEFES